MTKQTRCPNCHRLYRVSIPQLTVAQGMVCCEKCNYDFNALLNLLPDAEYQLNHAKNKTSQQRIAFTYIQPALHTSKPQDLEIFTRSVQNSNLDLKDYLNKIKYREHQSIAYFPTLNLSSKHVSLPSKSPVRSFHYYLAWGSINLSLILLFIFQVLWFNPALIERHPFLNVWLNQTCQILHCDEKNPVSKRINIQDINIVPSPHHQAAPANE